MKTPLRLPLAVFGILQLFGNLTICGADDAARAEKISNLPANEWVLLHREDSSGGKKFARAVFAGDPGRMYLWGTGGEKPAQNVYRRYELESFDPACKATITFPFRRRLEFPG